VDALSDLVVQVEPVLSLLGFFVGWVGGAIVGVVFVHAT